MNNNNLIKQLKEDKFTVSIELEADEKQIRTIAYLEEKIISKEKSDYLKNKYSNAVCLNEYSEDGMMNLGFNFISYIH